MMVLNRDQIMSEAMKLDPRDREALAEELLRSIPDTERSSIEAAWLEEARRREAAFSAGRTEAIPVDEAIKRCLSKGQP